MRLFLGNLAYKAEEAEIRALFEGVGCEVVEIGLPIDRETGKKRGFGFVTVTGGRWRELNGVEFFGRALRIDEANERPARPGRR